MSAAESHGASPLDLDATFLPGGAMRQLSRVTEVGDHSITGEVDLAGHWAFPVHFPGDPIFPGSLLVEAAGQLVAAWAWWKGQRGRPRLLKAGSEFRGPVEPDAGVVVLRARLRTRRNVSRGTVDAFVEGRKVARVEVVLAVLDA